MEFIVLSVVFLMLLLFIVWRPFFKQSKQVVSNQCNLRDETNIHLYHEHKKEIEKDYAAGGIDEESYQYLLAELDKALLQDIDNKVTPDLTPTSQASSTSRYFSVFWPISLTIFIIFFSVALYDKQGIYQEIVQVKSLPATNVQQDKTTNDELNEQRQKEAFANIEKLTQQILKDSNNSEVWYNLGQAFVLVGNFDDAINAFEQVMRIEGVHADLLGVIAQASYYRNNQQIDAKIQALIDRALALDINDASTNILLGMHNFIEQNYQLAIMHWQRVINVGEKDVNISALQGAVTEAKNRLDKLQTNVQSDSDNVEQVKDKGPQLKVNVTLADNITDLLSQGNDRVVFVYAIPTNGQRMPLAAVKIMASDLPTVVVLNDSQAMSAQNNLSSVKQVHIFAVLSKLGSVGIKSGDYKAELKNIDVSSTQTLNLLVDSVVE